MIVGVPKEIKKDESRVGLTPACVSAFVGNGHEVLIERGAGLGSGFSDEEYEKEGAEIVDSAEEVFSRSEMVIKVKEPQPSEIDMLREGQILYTYLHLAPDRFQTEGLIDSGVVAIAYETIEVNGKLPLLEPMSEIAGKMASMMGAYFLERPFGGRGVLAGGVAGVHSARFLILGGGTAGLNAARIAAGLGARVVVMDVNLERMRYLEDVLPPNCEMIMSNRLNIEDEIVRADVIVGTVLIPGAKTPKLITRDMVKEMQKGAVIVDVSIDQGGCAETSSPTTHEDPVFEVDGVIHYCVANMPGAYSRSSTFALTNATLPFGLEIANKGWRVAALDNPAIRKGINVAMGKVTCLPVAEAHGIEYEDIDELLH